ncbi:MAG: hypothetical protein GY713_08725 [Actinomycetia bacterium]|nr:hypothetical protein [Actinomycetes bacterium]
MGCWFISSPSLPIAFVVILAAACGTDSEGGASATTIGPSPTMATTTGAAQEVEVWFTAAGEGGEESPPPNDYYVPNGSELVRALSAGATTEVKWLPVPGDRASATDAGYAEWVSQRESRDYPPGVWLTVTDGAVEMVVEQYVP